MQLAIIIALAGLGVLAAKKAFGGPSAAEVATDRNRVIHNVVAGLQQAVLQYRLPEALEAEVRACVADWTIVSQGGRLGDDAFESWQRRVSGLARRVNEAAGTDIVGVDAPWLRAAKDYGPPLLALTAAAGAIALWRKGAR